MIRALATCGVYGPPSDDELVVLTLADEFRAALCDIHQERHQRTTDYRNMHYPALWSAMVEYEAASALIWEIERDIKALHSQERNRNVRTDEQTEALNVARQRKTNASKRIKAEKGPWLSFLKEYRLHFKSAADWINVKSLEKRRALYESLAWPAHLSEFASTMLSLDLRERELFRDYQLRGLHSAIRGEIVDASQPKLGKDKPGIRYRYGRRPAPKQWCKIVVRFVGGLAWSDALEGKNQSFSLEPDPRAGYVRSLYRVSQQIGTADHPRRIEYVVKMHREPPPDAKIQRWTLKIVGRRRVAIPIMAGLSDDKPTGEGVLRYDLTWTRRKAGVQVCHFVSDKINEALILPNWLVENRMALKDAQAACDLTANSELSRLGRRPPQGKRQGLIALSDYCRQYPEVAGAANVLDVLQRELRRAEKLSTKAIGCIEKIYETVASRVCKLHSAIVLDPISLAVVKRYDTRDLLKDDPLPAKSRELMHAVAVGKLQALLKRYGLPVLWIDSPGGTVAGTEQLASDVRRAAGVKPVIAYVDDCCCSAAYWVASQASKIFVTPTALTGSIGTYSSVEDVSGAYEKAGVRVVVVAAGKYKGIGTRGTKVTDEQIAHLQKMINALNEQFLEAVGAGRHMNAERVRAIADGGVFVGKAAIAAGLADAVGSFDRVLAEISKAAAFRPLTVLQQQVASLTAEVQKHSTAMSTSGGGHQSSVSPAAHSLLGGRRPDVVVELLAINNDAAPDRPMRRK